MRLWHKNLITILPKLQLLGQWRECCAIASNIGALGTPNHLLVNKIMKYDMAHFATYCDLVQWEMTKRGYSPSPLTIGNIENCIRREISSYVPYDILFDGWHNDRYLWQCLSNLEEKYDCGGIPDEEWQLIDEAITYIL